MEQQSPVSRPKAKSRRLSRLGGCLIALVALVFGGIAIVRILIWGTVFPRHGQFPWAVREPEAIDPSLPRIVTDAELRTALAGFSGKEFVFYAAIPGMGDAVRTTVETEGADEEAIAARVAAFAWLVANYAGLKTAALEGMTESYSGMRRAVVEKFDGQGSSARKFILWLSGFPAMRDMLPLIETPGKMEEYWRDPRVIIAPVAGEENTEPKIVVQAFPPWHPADTFGVVLYRGEIVYAGDNPDHQWQAPPLLRLPELGSDRLR